RGCRGDAAPFPRAGGERPRVSGADTLPRSPRRPRARCRPGDHRPARPLVPAEASLALRLPPARDLMCRVRRRHGPCRLLAARGRRGLPELRQRRVTAFPRGLARNRRAAPAPPGRCRRSRPDRAGSTRGPRGDHRLVRVPRRLPPTDTQRVEGRTGPGGPVLEALPRKGRIHKTGEAACFFPRIGRLAVPTFQDTIRALEGYWADYGCVLMQPY